MASRLHLNDEVAGETASCQRRLELRLWGHYVHSHRIMLPRPLRCHHVQLHNTLALGNWFLDGPVVPTFHASGNRSTAGFSLTVPIFARTAARPRPESRGAPAYASAVPKVIRSTMRQTLLFAVNAMTVGHHIQPCDVNIAAFYST
jgi:hypothetical protein